MNETHIGQAKPTTFSYINIDKIWHRILGVYSNQHTGTVLVLYDDDAFAAAAAAVAAAMRIEETNYRKIIFHRRSINR